VFEYLVSAKRKKETNKQIKKASKNKDSNGVISEVNKN
jgi:hypothetical protein